ncbi:hypothetical protein [Streptacidiphilus pinicola]|uniref:hypothetical protein n=1 Tax=Streptacidiphilus pinicola TaxID=2219663 RepID=UPI001FB44501|nr:hypothetical protein [Streptacidiphilus pinicola]
MGPAAAQDEADNADAAGRRRARLVSRPLFAAGFTTAFGAHGVAANLGAFTSGRHESLLVLGGLLALYDGAEVLLKPVFGSLADRIGCAPACSSPPPDSPSPSCPAWQACSRRRWRSASAPG